jgi:hypothetical protein
MVGGAYHSSMPFAPTVYSPPELLIDEGIDFTLAHELAERYGAERIEQAIQCYFIASKIHDLRPEWIVNCLHGDWLPHVLFRDKPPDRDSAERRENLLLCGKSAFVEAVEQVIGRLSRLEWEWLSGKVVMTEEDQWYKRQMFDNPTRSNWILCEKVYALWKRGYLGSDKYRPYLLARARGDMG